jgi:HAD superfamily phosphatase (TIGR01668 family)
MEDGMFERFYPDLKVDSVQDIDFNLLKNKRIKGVLLDIDNTLVPMHMKEADAKAVEWIEKLKTAGFKVCIVSNASNKRVIKFNERLKVYAFHRASKPGSRIFLKALRLMNIRPEEAAMVGDQIFTDIYGGNRLNMYTILVKPIDEREAFWIRMKRFPEKFVLTSHSRKSKNHDHRRVEWKKKTAERRIKKYS